MGKRLVYIPPAERASVEDTAHTMIAPGAICVIAFRSVQNTIGDPRVPLCVLGMGVLLHLVDMGNGQVGSEVAFITAKSLIGIGRGFYQTAAQFSVQAVVSRQEVSVVTAVFFASMSVGGAVGTRYARITYSIDYRKDYSHLF